MGNFFEGAGGGLIGGLFGLAGSAIDAAASKKQQERQQQHDMDMAALNQQNQLEQMAVQNQYQIDQWNRENEYNDPSAVAARYRKAGINPRAAFGQGSASGAGIAGGFSSAPSGSNTGSASNIMFDTNFAGIAGNILTGARLQAQNRKDEAEADKAYEDARSKALSNAEAEFMRENGAWQSKLTETKSNALSATYTANMKKIDSDLYDFEHKLDLHNKYLAGQSAIANINLANANIDRLTKLNELTDEEKKLLQSQRTKNESEIKRINADNEFYSRFGFYPAPGSSLESALVGLGAKGIGEFADSFRKPKQKRNANVVTEQLVDDWKKAKTPEEKRKVVHKAQSNAMNMPLSRGIH